MSPLVVPLLYLMGKDKKKVERSSQAEAPARTKNARNTQTTPSGRVAEHLKGVCLRSWLWPPKSQRVHSTTTDITEAAIQAPSAGRSSTLQPPDETQVLQPVLRQRDTVLDDSPPPAYDDQGALAPLYMGLSREDEIRIIQFVDSIMPKVHDLLARSLDLATLTPIAAAVREGCICAGATVCKATLQKTAAEVNDTVNEGCQKAVRALIAAVTAAPERKWIGVADGAATTIALVAQHVLVLGEMTTMTFVAKSQLTTALNAAAAIVTLRSINKNHDLSDIPLPARKEFLSGP
ncbi:hypothetical protein SUNI508_13859 [Seiridium unicorne]|uniref:Uncharacterized protein n=1 Tax=Seiridium unicorne TaxID=138068 RepID=A0ABR2VAR9_9PEZI